MLPTDRSELQFEQRGCLGCELRLPEFRQAFRLPEIAELSNCCGRVASVVIVSVSEDFYAPPSGFIADVHPTSQFVRAIDDRLVPRRCNTFNSLSIAEPADVRPVRGNRIECPRQVARVRRS